MAIRIRVYPQPGSIGLRRRRVAQQQRQQLIRQQVQLNYQQQLLRQQQFQRVGFGYTGGYGTGLGYGAGYGFGSTGYTPGYVNQSVSQYGYGSPSQFASSWGVAQVPSYAATCPPTFGGYGFDASPYLGASFLGASAYAPC